MQNKLKVKFELEVDDIKELEQLVSLVKDQVSHLWSVWDKKSTDDQKILMDIVQKTNKLPEDIESFFTSKSEMMMFMLRAKDCFWNYSNAFKIMVSLQKAYDKWNYDKLEPFEDKHYGLMWEAN